MTEFPPTLRDSVGSLIAALMLMRATKYQTIGALALLIALADGIFLCLMLLWFVAGQGIIACGKGIFDDPAWPLSVLVLVGVPAGLLASLIALVRHCSRRLGRG